MSYPSLFLAVVVLATAYFLATRCPDVQQLHSGICMSLRRLTKRPTLNKKPSHSGPQEVAVALSQLINDDGAGSWPPRADHDNWPLALRPYKEIYLEVVPYLSEPTVSLDDSINAERQSKFRDSMRKLLAERINISEVVAILGAVEKGDWSVLSRDSYNGFYSCIAVCRHAFRWATIPVVKVAQLETTLAFPPELDAPWPYLQSHFGLTADSGNIMSNVVLGFNPSGTERVYKINVGADIPDLVKSSEDAFYRIFYDMETRANYQALPLYHSMVNAITAFETDDKPSCLHHITDLATGLRGLLRVFYNSLHEGRIAHSVWLSYVQGFQAWGIGRVIDGEFVKFDGLSGNHVLIFHAVDAFLGIDRYLNDRDTERYIPRNQRALADALRKNSFRGRIGEGDERIEMELSEIAKQLRTFRAAHRSRGLTYLEEPAPERLPMTAGKSVLKDSRREMSAPALTQIMDMIPQSWVDARPHQQLLVALGAAAAAVLTAALLQAVYRLCFHPLANIPGPRLAAVTEYWRWYYEIKGALPFKLKESQEKHNWPPILRVGPNHVVVHDPTQHEVIYPVSSKFLKDRGFYERWTSGRNGGTTVTAWYVLWTIAGLDVVLTESSDKKKHALRRKDTMGQLSKQKVEDLHPLVASKLSIFLQRVQEHYESRQPVNVFSAWRCYTLDIISEFAFGQCLNALDNPDFENSMIETIDKFVGKFNLAIRLPSFVLSLSTKPIIRDYLPGAKEMGIFFKWANSCVINYRPNKDKHCLFDILMDPNRPEQLTIAQLQSEAEDTLVAGSDTTATTLTYACAHLARQPDLWERLHREIKPVYGPADQIPALRPLENVALLTACVRESLRLATPSPSYLWRTVPEEGYTLHHTTKSYFAPPKTVIGMSAWNEHFNTDIFPSPDEFKPSRWLLGPNNGGVSGPNGDLDRYLVPFSKGSRQCGGMNLAFMEMYLGLAAMIMRFRIKGEKEPGKAMVQREQFVGLLQDSEWNIFFEPRADE
ncbi:cytochrome P450 [Cercophora scortea]|uniref:Cytochrome P450 n=1 Tax=Cercophora scortea TaxID=314031 RepID=A0AAE0J662_9PEZI|nr:cytochrome P450 [Cercophora scortea]